MMFKKKLVRTAGLACVALLMGALMMVPSASAQETNTYAQPKPSFDFEDPFLCEYGFTGRISGGVAPYTISHQLTTDGRTIDLTALTVPAAGDWVLPPSAVRGVANATYDIRVTATDSTGQVAVRTFSARISALCPSPSRLSIELPTGTTALPPALAVTGSNLDTPVVIGFLLVGMGGLALLEARNRQRRKSVTL